MFKDNEQQPEGFQVPLQEALDNLKLTDDGLIAAIAQQHDTGEVLMMAWMNREALEETLATGRVCYFSRSRKTPCGAKANPPARYRCSKNYALIATPTPCW